MQCHEDTHLQTWAHSKFNNSCKVWALQTELSRFIMWFFSQSIGCCDWCIQSDTSQPEHEILSIKLKCKAKDNWTPCLCFKTWFCNFPFDFATRPKTAWPHPFSRAIKNTFSNLLQFLNASNKRVFLFLKFFNCFMKVKTLPVLRVIMPGYQTQPAQV